MRNDGRAFVVITKVKAFAAKLLNVQLVGFVTCGFSSGFSLCVHGFNVVWHGTACFDHFLRMVHHEMRDLLCDGEAFGFVGVQNGGRCPALDGGV